MQRILDALSEIRAPLAQDERLLHDAVEAALGAAGISFTREARIGPRCRVDFLCEGGIAIEVKRGKPCAKRLLPQLRRYAACDSVNAIVVAVERSAYVPKSIGGKPCALFGLNRLWGVAL